MKAITIATAALLAWGAVSSPAAAQFGLYQPGTINGTGIVDIERQPDRMRVRVDLLSRGGSIQEAVDALRDRIEAGRAQLAALGAVEDSIDVGDPRLDVRQDEQRRQIEQMIAQRLRGGARGRQDEETDQPVTVSATLTAEWQLEAADASELLIRAHELQEQVREADLSGSEEAGQLSPEEQEILEETQGMFDMYGGSGEPKPGEPVFSFVAQISDEEYEQALAEAFEKARAQALLLAKAAGTEVGGLQHVSSTSQPAADEEQQYQYYGSYFYQAYQMLGIDKSGEQPDQKKEAVGLQPGKATYRVSVTAGFGLKE